MSWYEVMLTPLGAVFVGGSASGLHRVDFMTETHALRWFLDRLAGDAGERPERDPVGAEAAVEQLRAYFAGSRLRFDLALAPRGTVFQREVWRELSAIAPGETRSYGDVARAIGRPGASRAVGAANSRNPLAIVVPCHRVIGADGTLTGYASGLDRKRWLLEHERATVSTRGRRAGQRVRA
ncbi:MAG: methylated-DNA--[protein]-cysteine S-methyltransferase [Chloroflexi bacterium]|nr:methylated-DNA--[protein]-cysteine S-methyltransferase [Chloroflexota bacterium]